MNIQTPAVYDGWSGAVVHEGAYLDHELNEGAVVGQTVAWPGGQPEVLHLLRLLGLTTVKKVSEFKINFDFEKKNALISQISEIS